MDLSELHDRDATISRIVQQATGGVSCYEYGACTYLAYDITRLLLAAGIKDFVVKEGWVDDGGEIPSAHTWIEMSDGKEIDPSFAGIFGSEASKTADIQAIFRPHEFVEYAQEDLGL